MLTFVKLGGSLITDKRTQKSFKRDVMMRLSDEIALALNVDPSLRILLGHGSGSFGHFAASKVDLKAGIQSNSDWRSFADIANAAAELNHLVSDCLQSAGVPIWRFQPSASLVSDAGNVIYMNIEGIKTVLSAGIVPLVYGDVSLDKELGCAIVSTEKLFFYLASELLVQRIFLLGEVQGVYSSNGQVIPLITPMNYDEVSNAIGGSAGVDVTGGMESKVTDMLGIVSVDMTIRIFSGLTAGLLTSTLLGQSTPGTLISVSK